MPDELNSGASGVNLELVVVCPLNWLSTGGVAYNVVEVEPRCTVDCVLS